MGPFRAAATSSRLLAGTFFLLLAGSSAARAGWTAFRTGQLEVITDAGDRPAQELLATFDQIQWLTAHLLGRDEVRPMWPVRLLILKKNDANARYITSSIQLHRDAYSGAMYEREPIPRQWIRDFTTLLLADDVGILPPNIEAGLIEVLSSVQVDATHINLSPPADVKRRTIDWARMYMLAGNPDNGSRTRVFFSNLQQGAPLDVVYRNSFGKSEKEMEAEVRAYLLGAKFDNYTFYGKPLNPDRDYRPREVDDNRAAVVLADLLSGDAARTAYLAVLNRDAKDSDALDGAGMYAEATQAESHNARAWVAYGLTLQDPAKAWDAFQRAAQLNPRWEVPHLRLGDLEKTLDRKVVHLKKAIELAPRDISIWLKLADAQVEAKDFEGAEISWRSAERATPDPAERTRIAKIRTDFEQKRIDLEAAERQRQADEKERELAKLKAEAMASIHAAEERVNAGDKPANPDRVVVPWFDGPGGPKVTVTGQLERVDCLNDRLRLHVRADGKLAQYLIADPKNILVIGGGEQSLACGVQRPAKKLKLDYAPKPDAKLGTAGEVTQIEFQ